jgi:2-polyprenyl-3-methyl-5-hydroxy-6-metoxy-1,4-benzoquinol methylase
MWGGMTAFFASLVKGVNPDIMVDSVDLCENLTQSPKSVRMNYNYDVTKPWPLTPDSYDGIHLGAIIEHVFDYKNLFEENFRVLKPGGCLFISTPNMACLKHRVEIIFGRMPA